MNQINQGESSGGPSTYPAKRSRGRPRKDPNRKHMGPTHVPPGIQAPKENTPHKPNRTEALDPMVGQAVTGVVESTFDAGYLLSLKIGNSTTQFRGLVFKPGHYVPITAENDVAPHVPMIGRNSIPIPAENHKLAIQTARRKRKYSSPKIPLSVPPVGVRGNLVPVVLQPVNTRTPPNGAQTAHLMNFGDKDVHMVEPLSMLPPDRSIPVGQIFAGPQPHKENNLFNEGAFEVGQGEKVEPVKSTDVDKSSEKSAQEIGITKEHSSNESPTVASVTKSLFSYGTGRMTELLQAVQENMKENLVQVAEQPNSSSKVEFHEIRVMGTDPRNGASVP